MNKRLIYDQKLKELRSLQTYLLEKYLPLNGLDRHRLLSCDEELHKATIEYIDEYTK